jgi:hypothetical protein
VRERRECVYVCVCVCVCVDSDSPILRHARNPLLLFLPFRPRGLLTCGMLVLALWLSAHRSLSSSALLMSSQGWWYSTARLNELRGGRGKREREKEREREGGGEFGNGGLVTYRHLQPPLPPFSSPGFHSAPIAFLPQPHRLSAQAASQLERVSGGALRVSCGAESSAARKGSQTSERPEREGPGDQEERGRMDH